MWAVYILKKVGQDMNSEKRGFVETRWSNPWHGLLKKKKSDQLDFSWCSEMFEKFEWYKQ